MECMPRAGGLFDQDPLMIKGMMIVRGLQAEKRNRDMPKPKAK